MANDKPRPLRSVDPIARVMLGVVIALLALVSTFTISAHLTTNAVERNQQVVDRAVVAACEKYHLLCVPQPTTPTTTP